MVEAGNHALNVDIGVTGGRHSWRTAELHFSGGGGQAASGVVFAAIRAAGLGRADAIKSFGGESVERRARGGGSQFEAFLVHWNPGLKHLRVIVMSSGYAGARLESGVELREFCAEATAYRCSGLCTPRSPGQRPTTGRDTAKLGRKEERLQMDHFEIVE